MSEYTPTTEHVRDLALRLMNAAEFDAWLAKVKAVARREGQAEAWADAVASAYLHETEHFISIKHDPNPYLEDRHVDQ